MAANPQSSYLLRLDPELAAALRRRAELEDRPISRIVRTALRRYLGLEPPIRPARYRPTGPE